jgi:hypothetical protein
MTENVLPSHELPRDIALQRLVAVPWRHAGLIAACALAGGVAAMVWQQPAPRRVAALKPRVQAIQDAPARVADGLALRLDTEPGAAAVDPGAARAADTAILVSRTLRLDTAHPLDEIELALRQAPPAAGVVASGAPARERPDVALPGLALGLLLGLGVAARRELHGQRMRSPREAEWALGAPVLAAIPTLSSKARDALLDPRGAA